MRATPDEPASARRLLAAVGPRARLSFYPPGLRQPAHRHDQAHMSIVIAGSLREVGAGRDEMGFTSSLTLRPYEFEHQVEFGLQGALILAIDLEDDVPGTTGGWIHRKLSSVQRTLLRWVLTGGVACHANVDECIDDLVADAGKESLRGSPPLWLLRARERLTDDPAGARIEALAREAGVHRAHFARAFQHWFKAPPSLFRRHGMLCRAMAAVACGQSLALAAHHAGFADQSHLCRAMRSALDTTPYRLLRRA